MERADIVIGEAKSRPDFVRKSRVILPRACLSRFTTSLQGFEEAFLIEFVDQRQVHEFPRLGCLCLGIGGPIQDELN